MGLDAWGRIDDHSPDGMTLPDVDAQLEPRPLWRSLAAGAVLLAGGTWIAVLLAKEAPTSVTLRIMLPPALVHASRLEARVSDGQDVLAQLSLARTCSDTPCSAAWPGKHGATVGGQQHGGQLANRSAGAASIEWALTLQPGRYALTLVDEKSGCQRQTIAIAREWALDTPTYHIQGARFVDCGTAEQTPADGQAPAAHGDAAR